MKRKMSINIVCLCVFSKMFSIFVISAGKILPKKDKDRMNWSVKSLCHHCIHMVTCPVICGGIFPTTSQPKLPTNFPPIKIPLTLLPISKIQTTVQPATIPAPTKPSIGIPIPRPQPHLTSAPPIIPAPSTTPAHPTQPPTPAPLLPKPAPLIEPPASLTPAPPKKPTTLAPPIQPPKPPPPQVTVPQVIPTPPSTTPALSIQPLTHAPPLTPTIAHQVTVAPPTVPQAQPPTPQVPSRPGELSCAKKVEKKGCYKDDQKPPRPLPNYILTDRDRSMKIYSGKDIDWEGWINYLPDLVCRCAQLAGFKGFQFFGIQFYGECWSGPSRNESLFKEDGNSTDCVDINWKKCSDRSKYVCAGKQFSNYVYAIVQ